MNSTRSWRSRAALALIEHTSLADPETAIKLRARKLLSEGGIDGPPTELEILALFQNIGEIRKCHMRNAGRLVPLPNGQLRIEVREQDVPERQNFTIAHEIAHTLIPSPINEVIEVVKTGAFQLDSGEGNEEEHLCDIGAAALLMDTSWLHKHVRGRSIDIAMLQSAAKTFQVSLHAMARQLSAIAETSMAFVIWEPRTNANMMTATSVYWSESFPVESRMQYRTAIPAWSRIFEAAEERKRRLTCFCAPEDLGLAGEQRLKVDSWYVPFAGKRRFITALSIPIRPQQRFTWANYNGPRES